MRCVSLVLSARLKTNFKTEDYLTIPIKNKTSHQRVKMTLEMDKGWSENRRTYRKFLATPSMAATILAYIVAPRCSNYILQKKQRYSPAAAHMAAALSRILNNRSFESCN